MLDGAMTHVTATVVAVMVIDPRQCWAQCEHSQWAGCWHGLAYGSRLELSMTAWLAPNAMKKWRGTYAVGVGRAGAEFEAAVSAPTTCQGGSVSQCW